jgi:prevent-host-death family protein
MAKYVHRDSKTGQFKSEPRRRTKAVAGSLLTHAVGSSLVRRVVQQKERVVVTHRGKEVAALVPLEDLAVLQQVEDQADLAAAQEALAEIEKEGTVSWEQVKAELGL